MSEKTLGVISLIVLAVLLGGLFTYGFLPRTEVEVKEVIVNKEVIKEVVKEVPVVQNVSVNSYQTDVNRALDEFLDEVEDNDNLLECDNETYDFDQVSVSKLYDESTVSYDDDRYSDTTTVDFEVRLKYTDKDVEEKCYRNFEVTVEFETGEKPVLSY